MPCTLRVNDNVLLCEDIFFHHCERNLMVNYTRNDHKVSGETEQATHDPTREQYWGTLLACYFRSMGSVAIYPQ